jgi:MIP family channel proteins
VNDSMMRRYIAEFIGTFGIVFAPVALAAAGHTSGEIGLVMAALVSGLTVTVMIYALGHISAAHFNPAVTFGFAVARRFPWRFVPGYWAAQLLGSITAAGLVTLLFGSGFGAHIPHVSAGHAVAIETLLTFLLMLVIISVATDARVDGAVPGIAIGLTVVVDVFIGGSLTGGSMNPARSLGPALFAGGTALSCYWIYVIGPVFGAVIAAGTYEAIRGDEIYAKGAPNDLYMALREIEDKAIATG